MITPFYKSEDRNFTLLKGNCIELLKSFDFKFDMIFADPPYHLSNGGISVQSGKMVSVNKGNWDKSGGVEEDYLFDKEWLSVCRDKLKNNGTIWVSGTYHNIFSIARCLTELGFKILNCITWVKTNPPPNLSCRYFTASSVMPYAGNVAPFLAITNESDNLFLRLYKIALSPSEKVKGETFATLLTVLRISGST